MHICFDITDTFHISPTTNITRHQHDAEEYTQQIMHTTLITGRSLIIYDWKTQARQITKKEEKS